jgi:uncharacterized protein with HEPN domain
MTDDDRTRRGRLGRRPADSGLPVTDTTERHVRHLVDRAQDAAHVVARGQEKFFEAGWEGRERRRSARMLIVEISTILNERLPQEVRDAHPEVPWRQISAMRNWATHVYDRVDDTIVWDALVHDVPAVTAALGIRAR